MCIVIHGKTVIGNNVNLSQFLNIGSNHNTPAVIGDEVYIGPMTCLVEDVQIGNNSTIGAGAVVTKDVAKETIVAGVPAKLIRQDSNRPQHCWELPPVQN
jgi:serine O-acetyltransferase